MTTIHRVKCFERFFKSAASGTKTFEVRKNDRDYQIGDLLELNETSEGAYTGSMRLYRITYILRSNDFPDGIRDGFAVLGIEPITDVYVGDGGVQ